MAPESSKQAKKRAKKQKIAIEAALMNDPNVGLRLSERQGSNSANQERERGKKQKRTRKTKRTEQEESNRPLDEISTEFRAQMSNPSNDTQGTTKARGPTRCSALPVESGNRLEVELNENRQPIGDNSVHLSTFVGCLTRKMVSITFGDWRRVPIETKEYYWQAVKQKFTFKEEDEDDAKTYVLQKMGILARSNKSKLGTDLKNKPDYIEQSEWEVFVKTRSTKKWKEKTTMFKEMRGKQSMPYRGSRKGFARITDEILKKEGSCSKEKIRLRAWVRGYTNEKSGAGNPEDNELIKKAKEILVAPSPEGSPHTRVNVDALSQVLPQPERRGRIRGVGAGSSTSKLVSQRKYAAKISGLEKTVESLKENIGSLTTLVEQQTKLINTLMGYQKHDQPEEDAEVNMDEDLNCNSKASMQGQIDSISKIVENQTNLITDLLNKQGNHQQKQMEELDYEEEESDEGSDKDEEDSNQEKLGSQKEIVKSNETPSTTPQSHNSSHLGKVKCKLFSWSNPKELIALGKLSTNDPKEVVHGKPLGEGVSRVWVEMAYQPKAPLFRPCFGNEVVEDVIGSTTAWPTIDIMMVD